MTTIVFLRSSSFHKHKQKENVFNSCFYLEVYFTFKWLIEKDLGISLNFVLLWCTFPLKYVNYGHIIVWNWIYRIEIIKEREGKSLSFMNHVMIDQNNTTWEMWAQSCGDKIQNIKQHEAAMRTKTLIFWMSLNIKAFTNTVSGHKLSCYLS